MSKSMYLIFLTSVVLLLLSRLFHFYTTRHAYTDGEAVTLTQTLLSDSLNTGRYQSIRVSDSHGNPIYVTAPTQPVFRYGDTLTIAGEISVKTTLKRGETYSLQNAQIERVEGHPLFILLSVIRERVRSSYIAFMGPLESSLLMGIVFGIKEPFPEAFTKQLQTTGVFHVIAASGMNISMVGGTLIFLLKKWFRRQIALVLSMGILCLYAILSGLEPSILRATIMSGIAFSASILGRQNSGFTALFTTGFVMLFIQPYLLSDVGFHLSFLSTFGIMTIKPLITPSGKFFEGSLFDDIFTTTSSQLITLPIMFSVFGNYGILSILVNALVLWSIPPLMILGGVGALVGVISPWIAFPFLYLSLPFLWFFELVIRFFGSNGANVSVSQFPVLFSLGYYLLLFSFCLFLKKRKTYA